MHNTVICRPQNMTHQKYKHMHKQEHYNSVKKSIRYVTHGHKDVLAAHHVLARHMGYDVAYTKMR